MPSTPLPNADSNFQPTMIDSAMHKRLVVALSILCLLAACSGGEAPRPAELIPPAPAHASFGDLRVHYNALPTLTLGEGVAREYGVKREDGSALLFIALRRGQDSTEVPADGKVSATVTDLSGKRQTVALRPVVTGEYTDHIGTFAVSERDSYRIDVNVRSDGRNETVRFQRNF